MSNGQTSLSESQVQTLIKYLTAKSLWNCDGRRNRLAVSLMLFAGLRIGECVQITWEMLVLNNTILESINLDASITKSKSARVVPICASLRSAIVQFLGSNPTLCGLVFPGMGSKHEHLTPRTIQLVLAKASLECLGIKLHCHQLRHTFASRMLKCSNLRIVQELLGHSSVRSTQVYTHPDQEDLILASRALDDLNKGL